MHTNDFMTTLVLTGQIAYVSASVVRNNASKSAVVAQSFLSLGLLIVSLLALRDITHIVYAFFNLLYLAGTLEIARFLRRRTLDLLLVEERAETAIRDLAKANELLNIAASTDGLTGAVNRRGFDDSLTRECARSIEEHSPLSLLLLDIDCFKALNDVSGHQAGDICLQMLARCLRACAQEDRGVVARYGGEEFAILYPNTDEVAAGYRAERLRIAIEDLAIYHPTSGHVTVSGGCATMRVSHTFDASELVKRADVALYRAKAEGRNRTICYDKIWPTPRILDAAA